MFLMIDNYDSYVYNLVSYMRELDMELQIIRHDEICWNQLENQIQRKKLKGIIFSPGPKHPKDFTYAKIILQRFGQRIPILGVCLGHQMIADAYGAKVQKGPCPMHGKLSRIKHNHTYLFQNLPDDFQVTRYHSLVVSDEDFPSKLSIDARSDDGMIMAIHHNSLPVFGIQFHPEAILTEYGHDLLKNYKQICENYSNR